MVDVQAAGEGLGGEVEQAVGAAFGQGRQPLGVVALPPRAFAVWGWFGGRFRGRGRRAERGVQGFGGGGVAVGELPDQGAVAPPQVVQLVRWRWGVLGGGAVGVEQRQDRRGGLAQGGGAVGGGQLRELGLGDGEDVRGDGGDDGGEASHGGADDLDVTGADGAGRDDRCGGRQLRGHRRSGRGHGGGQGAGVAGQAGGFLVVDAYVVVEQSGQVAVPGLGDRVPGLQRRDGPVAAGLRQAQRGERRRGLGQRRPRPGREAAVFGLVRGCNAGHRPLGCGRRGVLNAVGVVVDLIGVLGVVVEEPLGDVVGDGCEFLVVEPGADVVPGGWGVVPGWGRFDGRSHPPSVEHVFEQRKRSNGAIPRPARRILPGQTVSIGHGSTPIRPSRDDSVARLPSCRGGRAPTTGTRAPSAPTRTDRVQRTRSTPNRPSRGDSARPSSNRPGTTPRSAIRP